MLDPKLRSTVLELERHYATMPPADAINDLVLRLVTLHQRHQALVDELAASRTTSCPFCARWAELQAMRVPEDTPAPAEGST